MTLPALALLLLTATGAAHAVQLIDASTPVQLGPRPFFLVEDLPGGPLKRRLAACAAERGIYRASRLAIGHRGAPLQFPEHTRESYLAAARMGAGTLECDVTFTRDLHLVCRHSQNDLHTTTNILLTPLAGKCSQPFRPASFDAEGRLVRPASAECRTSDLSLAEFKRLRGRMDAHDPRALSVEAYLDATPGWQTDLYAGPGSGTLMSHAESIELFKSLGVDMIPELKAPVVELPFAGMDRRAYADKLLAAYEHAGVEPERVWPQSFHLEDVEHWLAHGGEFGRQAVLLAGAGQRDQLPSRQQLQQLYEAGLRYYAPPLFALLHAGPNGRIVPSQHARDASEAGLGLITWTLERSGLIASGAPGFYYQGLERVLRREGQVLEVVDVLVRQVGVVGIFSDWPATVTFYANCMP